MKSIKIINTVKEMQKHSDLMIRQGKSIALIPTMGFLHEGHLSLMQEGARHADHLVVSIFVNPTQFGQGEDLEAYPKNFNRDMELCKKEGVDVIFKPDTPELYPENFQTYITLENLPNHLCGLSRPVHFKGVATIVTKLFNIVKPDIAIFGQKDFQQLAVIKQMVSDLHMPVKVIGAPIIREADGLAMSSRNTYLTPEKRSAALSLLESLNNAKQLIKDGVTDSNIIIKKATDIVKSHGDTKIDYISICDPETLENVRNIKKPVLMAMAVKVGKTRLIDNIILIP